MLKDLSLGSLGFPKKDYLNFNDNHLNKRKDKERLLLEKFQTSKEKITHDRNHKNINIFKCER